MKLGPVKIQTFRGRWERWVNDGLALLIFLTSNRMIALQFPEKCICLKGGCLEICKQNERETWK